MNKLVKKLFINYEYDMQPEINYIALHQKVKQNKINNNETKQYIKLRNSVRVVLTSLLIIITITSIRLLTSFGYISTEKQVLEAVSKEFSLDSDSPFISKPINTKDSLKFFLGEKNDELYIVLIPSRLKKYHIKLYDAEKLILELDMNKRLYESLKVDKDYYNLEVKVYHKQELIYDSPVIFDIKSIN